MNTIKKFWAGHKRTLVVVGTILTTIVALYTVNAHAQYLNALDETTDTNA